MVNELRKAGVETRRKGGMVLREEVMRALQTESNHGLWMYVGGRT